MRSIPLFTSEALTSLVPCLVAHVLAKATCSQQSKEQTKLKSITKSALRKSQCTKRSTTLNHYASATQLLSANHQKPKRPTLQLFRSHLRIDQLLVLNPGTQKLTKTMASGKIGRNHGWPRTVSKSIPNPHRNLSLRCCPVSKSRIRERLNLLRSSV